MKNGLYEKKMTFPEKRGCRVCVLDVNTPSPAALRRCWAAGRPEGAELLRGARLEKLEVNEAGRADKLGRHLLILSLRSLKLQVSEEICGRFGSFDGSSPAYQLPRIWRDCVGSDDG
jgi:hypothetical protein